jgi:hypothetical protein
MSLMSSCAFAMTEFNDLEVRYQNYIYKSMSAWVWITITRSAWVSKTITRSARTSHFDVGI